MTFTYSFQCGPSSYSEYTDEEFYPEEDFEYEIDWDEVRDAAAEILADDSLTRKMTEGKTKEEIKLMRQVAYATAKNIISYLDLEIDELMEEQLKEYFEDKAREAYYDR